MTESLFSGGSLLDRLRGELQEAGSFVAAHDADWLLDRTDEEVIVELLAFHAVEPLEIHWERTTTPGVREGSIEARNLVVFPGQPRTVQLPADKITFTVPFTGERDLLLLRPSTFSMSPPQARVRAHELVFSHTETKLTGKQVAAVFDQFRSEVEQLAATANANVDAHNRELEAALRRHVAERRQRLLDQRQLTASLPFTIRPLGAKGSYAIPVRRKRVHLTSPRPAAPFEPEPAVEAALYEDILERIAAFAHAVERTPMSVGAMDEEGLRDHLLLTLNTAYEGQAGGEVFSRSGKTDITVTTRDRHAFVAECKVWGGAAKFTEAVDQLLGYLVWRDSKAALVLFIKSGNATDIIGKADAAITGHPQCERRLDPAAPDARIDYLLRSTADDKRLIHTALLPVVVAGKHVGRGPT